VKAAGLDGLTPHDLRHTAASLAVAAGANVKSVQRMLGHASATMTLDVYAGLFGDDLDRVADLLDEAERKAAADSVRTREARGRVLPFAWGEGTRRDQGFAGSPRRESNP
jgi:Phage integrase family